MSPTVPNLTPSSGNAHLKAVFEQILPAIETAGLKYWVAGGIGVAGVLGRFIRMNEDVDIYVQHADYPAIRDVLVAFCDARSSWGWKDSLPLKGRPQINLYEGGAKRLSTVPVYNTADGVEFRTKISEILPITALYQELKQVGGFRFFSPPTEIIKLLLRSMLIERPKLLTDPDSRRRKDALALFTPPELSEIEQEIARRQDRRRL